MKRFIYQSPKNAKHFSAPIAEDNLKARRVLEAAHWRIVQTLDEDVEASVDTVEVEVVKPAPRRKRKGTP